MNVHVHFRRPLVPNLEHCLAPGLQREVATVELAVEVGEVVALVGATALGASQRGVRDQAHERVGVAGQRPQAGTVALESGVTPQRLAALLGQGRRRRWIGSGWLGGRVGGGLGERRACGASAEYEALGQ